jgi:hypothetical protein
MSHLCEPRIVLELPGTLSTDSNFSLSSETPNAVDNELVAGQVALTNPPEMRERRMVVAVSDNVRPGMRKAFIVEE